MHTPQPELRSTRQSECTSWGKQPQSYHLPIARSTSEMANWCFVVSKQNVFQKARPKIVSSPSISFYEKKECTWCMLVSLSDLVRAPDVSKSLANLKAKLCSLELRCTWRQGNMSHHTQHEPNPKAVLSKLCNMHFALKACPSFKLESRIHTWRQKAAKTPRKLLGLPSVHPHIPWLKH